MKACVLALLVTGCGDNVLVLEGAHHQYVVSEIRIPANNMQAREFGLDLDRNKTVDNQLGMIFGALEYYDLGVGDTATEALLRGGVIMLADVQTTDFANTELSGFTSYLGADPMPVPCLDPARFETCGQHLLGQGRFSIDDGSASDLGIGPINDGVFVSTVGVLPVELAIDLTGPIRLDLHGARVRLTEISETRIAGVIGGGITRADVDGVVIPQIAAQMDRIVDAECAPVGQGCDCSSSSRGELLQGYFDPNNDCRIQLTEVAGNGLIKNLLHSDIRVGGEELLSFGVGIELAAATFESR